MKKALSNRQDVLVSGDRFILPSEIFFKSADDNLKKMLKKELNKIASTLKKKFRLLYHKKLTGYLG